MMVENMERKLRAFCDEITQELANLAEGLIAIGKPVLLPLFSLCYRISKIGFIPILSQAQVVTQPADSR